jgi:DMSO/TMAO reductase YedYZ molybdopterin-dependent catalytic subunit
MADQSKDARSRRWLSALSGLISAAVAVGVAQLVAGIADPQSSPLIAVGETAIDHTPPWLKDFAIRTFGSNDKTALLAGMGITISILALILGWVNLRHPLVGPIGVGVFALLGAGAALGRPDATWGWAVPSIVGGVAGIVTILMLRARLGETSEDRVAPEGAPDSPPAPQPFDRRRFLRASGYGAVIAVVAGGAGRLIASRSAASASRADVRLPSPASPLPAPPSSVSLDVPSLSPFFTPNDAFYRVDTALLAPAVTADNWSLNIHGMVDKPMKLTFKELLAMPLVERDITLCCVSNPVGGPYISNARWLGVLLAPILREAGVSSGSTQIVTTSVDGFTIGTPTAVVMDGRDAMLAIGMNGQPLPISHGFPVRMIVPGLYGYVSAMKWLADMNLTTFQAFDAYWVQRGWAQQAPVITESRIDTPRNGASLKAGEVSVAGIAWAQHTGIESVAVQVDGGPFQQAELAAQDTIDTWRQWLFRWQATSGSHTLKVRATDRSGYTQTTVVTGPPPKGATGLHTINVSVS